MPIRAQALRDVWERMLREEGARLTFMVGELNGDTSGRLREHWKRLAPTLRGVEWKLPTWPNLFPVTRVYEKDTRTLPELIEETQTHLRTFVETWFTAGRNYTAWRNQFPELEFTLQEAHRSLHTEFGPAPDGTVQLSPVLEPSLSSRTQFVAACLFGDFLRNPFRDVLAGRCKRCHRYFFNRKGYEQMVYCSQRCRWAVHNKQKIRSREQAHRQHERTALAAMRRFERGLHGSRKTVGPENTWKDLVVKEVNKKHGTNFEVKWLTRTINNARGEHHEEFVREERLIEGMLRRKQRGTRKEKQ